MYWLAIQRVIEIGLIHHHTRNKFQITPLSFAPERRCIALLGCADAAAFAVEFVGGGSPHADASPHSGALFAIFPVPIVFFR